MSEEVYTVEHAAERLKLHPKTVLRFIRDGRLRAVKVGKSYRILRTEMEAMTGARPNPPGARGGRRVCRRVRARGASKQSLARSTRPPARKSRPRWSGLLSAPPTPAIIAAIMKEAPPGVDPGQWISQLLQALGTASDTAAEARSTPSSSP